MPRLFEENGFVDAAGTVLPLSEFKLFTDLENGNEIDPSARKFIHGPGAPLF